MERLARLKVPITFQFVKTAFTVSWIFGIVAETRRFDFCLGAFLATVEHLKFFWSSFEVTHLMVRELICQINYI